MARYSEKMDTDKEQEKQWLEEAENTMWGQRPHAKPPPMQPAGQAPHQLVNNNKGGTRVSDTSYSRWGGGDGVSSKFYS
jgi:hypothetical protein